MSSDFTKGNIMKSLLGFMAPVLGALWMCLRWERVLRS